MDESNYLLRNAIAVHNNEGAYMYKVIGVVYSYRWTWISWESADASL